MASSVTARRSGRWIRRLSPACTSQAPPSCRWKRRSGRTARILSDMASTKRTFVFLLVTAVAALLGARPAAAKVQVVTTIETFADLARKVGGDRVEVKALSRGYMDPHFVEPKPSLVIE